MIIGKRHLVLAALVLALGAAVYLNWQFAPTDEFVDLTSAQSSEVSEEKNLGDAQYVATTPKDASASDAAAQGDMEAVETEKKSTYFDDTRAEREKARNEALDTLKDIIGDASLDDAQKSDAVSKSAEIAGRMEKEASIESLVKAKGYADCVVVISDSQVNVVIPAPEDGLTTADAAVIRDIVIGQIDISPSCIKIIEAK